MESVSVPLQSTFAQWEITTKLLDNKLGQRTNVESSATARSRQGFERAKSSLLDGRLEECVTAATNTVAIPAIPRPFQVLSQMLIVAEEKDWKTLQVCSSKYAHHESLLLTTLQQHYRSSIDIIYAEPVESILKSDEVAQCGLHQLRALQEVMMAMFALLYRKFDTGSRGEPLEKPVQHEARETDAKSGQS